MAEDVSIQQGDCASSIAYQRGFFWETIWNHPRNADLKASRKDPNVLCEGDVLFVPDKDPGGVNRATEKRHRFVLKGVPAMLRLRFSEGGEPRRGGAYVLPIDGDPRSGKLDDNGQLEEPIPPDAKSARLRLGGPHAEEIELRLGTVDPITEVAGVQGRLNNLGFDAGETDGQMTPQTRSAIEAFQRRFGLSAEGALDQATRDKLVQVHG